MKFDDAIPYFLPLGGSNEIGMNLNLYRYNGRWLMVDLGIGFADDWLPGVDVIVPDISFLLEHKDEIDGLVITHGHEDHIGAIPYLWEELGLPMYATKFTANLIRGKLARVLEGRKAPITHVEAAKPFKVGAFDVELVPITHSIPEMHGLIIETKNGPIFHTGDWKLDPKPMVGASTDVDALKALGERGVLAMVCDSTNVMVEGESGSEGDVREALAEVVAGCKNRVVVATFASNIARLDSLMNAAKLSGRKVAMAGRSLWRMYEAATESGYLTEYDEPLSDDQGMDLPKDQVCFLVTGSQGEMRAALWRISRDDHPGVKLSKGDNVIFSSREIPGNEKRIGILQNLLVQKGINIISANDADIHVSGHPARDELKQMYEYIRPAIAVPVHGEQRHLREHADFAKNMQVPEAVVPYNGSIIALDKGNAKVVDEAPSGYVCVDGSSMLPSDGNVMRLRRKIKDNGLVMLTLVTSNGELASPPKISAPGLLDDQEDADWIEDIESAVNNKLTKMPKGSAPRVMEDASRSVLRRFFKKELEKFPVIKVHFINLG